MNSISNPISSRTRSRDDEYEDQITTIRLRSSIRGLEGLIISIPRNFEDDDDTSDFTYVETETTEESEEDNSDRSGLVNFDKLNKFVVTKSNKPADDCSICLDSFKCRQHSRRLHCSHIFHKKCIDRWLTKNTHCPVCRTSVQPLQPTTRRNIRILRSRRV